MSPELSPTAQALVAMTAILPKFDVLTHDLLAAVEERDAALADSGAMNEQLKALVRDLAPHCRYVDRKEAEAFKARIGAVLGPEGGA